MCSPDSPCALRPSAASGGSRASQSWPDVGPRWPEVRRRGGGGIWAGGYDTDNEAVPACAAAVRRTVVLMACLHRSRALHRSQARMRTRMAQAMRLPCFVTSFLSQSSVQVLVICPAQQPCPSVRRVGRERGGLRRADPGEARRAACRFSSSTASASKLFLVCILRLYERLYIASHTAPLQELESAHDSGYVRRSEAPRASELALPAGCPPMRCDTGNTDGPPHPERVALAVSQCCEVPVLSLLSFSVRSLSHRWLSSRCPIAHFFRYGGSAAAALPIRVGRAFCPTFRTRCVEL